MNKLLLLLVTVFIINGCATHAEINMPSVSEVYHNKYENKTLSYEVFYSQPKPGIFTGGQQLPLVPIENAEFSIASAKTLKKLPDYIFEQLPSSVKRIETNDGDFKLKVELVAHHKKGPAYADYEAAKSFGKSFVTLGFGSSEYDLVADFDTTYALYRKDELIHKKIYKINETVDHERGKFESYNSLNDFFKESVTKL